MPYKQDMEKLLPINVIRTGFRKHQSHVIRNDGFAAYQIAICTGGEGRFVFHGDKHIIKENNIFMFSPRIRHEYYPVSKNWQIYFFVFSGECVENIFKYFRFEEMSVFDSEAQMPKINELCRKLLETDDIYMQSLYLYELLGITSQLKKVSSSAISGNEHFKKIAPVTEYIYNNYKNSLSLEELGEIIGVSKSYLCRLFKETYGVTPIKYLQNHRINKSKQLLISTDMKLRSICAEVGINDISYFCMIFKEHEGMTPEEFRNIHN